MDVVFWIGAFLYTFGMLLESNVLERVRKKVENHQKVEVTWGWRQAVHITHVGMGLILIWLLITWANQP